MNGGPAAAAGWLAAAAGWLAAMAGWLAGWAAVGNDGGGGTAAAGVASVLLQAPTVSPRATRVVRRVSFIGRDTSHDGGDLASD